MTSPTNLNEYYTAKGQALPSVTERAGVAAEAGIQNYTGSAEQNATLLGHLTTKDPIVGPVEGKSPLSSTAASTTMQGTNGPLSSSTVINMANAPAPGNLVQANSTLPKLSDTVGKIAGATLGSTGKSIDSLKASLEASDAAQLKTEKDNATVLEGNLAKNIGGTTEQDAFNSITDSFKTRQTISQLQDINQKVVDAQEALNMGLVYEENRPARVQLLTGRGASLQKQGLATIGALQATASVLKGNIDLAYSYANAAIGAIKDDNEQSTDAIKTLLDLHEKNIVQLSKDERSTLEDRINDIEKQNNKLQTNSNDVTDLLVKYPYAFQQAGVTLLDSKATALTKMLPFLSAQEYQKENKGTSNAAFDAKDYPNLYASGLSEQDISDLQTIIKTDGVQAALDTMAEQGYPQNQINALNIALSGSAVDKTGTIIPTNNKNAVTVPKTAAQAKAVGDSFWSKISAAIFK